MEQLLQIVSADGGILNIETATLQPNPTIFLSLERFGKSPDSISLTLKQAVQLKQKIEEWCMAQTKPQ